MYYLKSNKLFVILSLLILVLVFSAYANHFNNDFHFDDTHVIENNIFVRSIQNIPSFFTDVRTHSSIPANQVYRPVLLSSFALDYWAGGGLNPVFFHITSFVLYLFQGILMFLVLWKIMEVAVPHPRNRYLALFAVGWYMLNPANTESVNYIFARSEILAALGVLGSFTLYLYVPKSRKFYLYLLPMIAGALAKISSVIFVPLFLVYILLFERKQSLFNIFKKSHWQPVGHTFKKVTPAFIIGVILFMFVQYMNAPTVVRSDISFAHYIASQPFSALHYLLSFFLPINLNADYDWDPVTNIFDGRLIIGIAAVIFLIYLAFKYSKRLRTRPIAFGIAWFLLALLPSSSIFPLAEVINDHRAFLPYIGLVLAIVWWLRTAILDKKLVFQKTPLTKAGIMFLVGALLAANTIGTHNRNKVWRTDEALWYDVIQKNPQNNRGLMNYAVTQMRQGRYNVAKVYLEKSQMLNPNYPYVEANLGVVEGKLNNPAAAEMHFEQALALNPNNQSALYLYALWLHEEGRSDEAIQKLNYLLKISPAHLNTRHLLMDIYFRQNDTARLAEIAAETLYYVPRDPVTLQYLSAIEGNR